MKNIKEEIKEIRNEFEKIEPSIKKKRDSKSTVWIHRLREIEEKIKEPKYEK